VLFIKIFAKEEEKKEVVLLLVFSSSLSLFFSSPLVVELEEKNLAVYSFVGGQKIQKTNSKNLVGLFSFSLSLLSFSPRRPPSR